MHHSNSKKSTFTYRKLLDNQRSQSLQRFCVATLSMDKAAPSQVLVSPGVVAVPRVSIFTAHGDRP